MAGARLDDASHVTGIGLFVDGGPTQV